MSVIPLSFTIPFIDRVTMPNRSKFMLDRLGPPHHDMAAQQATGDPLTWEYAKHGRLGWMQFFYDWRFADLTGDGTLDFILICGTTRQIAYRRDGSVLWKYEDPSGSLMDIRYDSNMPVTDIDGDGAAELICPRRINGRLHLCVVTGATGELKKSIPYPDRDGMPQSPQFGHLRSSVTVVNTSGKGCPSDILVYWDYRSLTLLDGGLNVQWTRRLEEMPPRRHRVFGHTPNAGDINGDGHDEILAGSVLFDYRGNVLWVAPDLPALVTDHHADSVQIVDFTGDGKRNMVMSTGAYCFSAGGELLFGYDKLKHGQAQRIGKTRDDIAGKQMLVYEGASRVDEALPDKIVALDCQGRLLWEHEVIQPDMQEGGFGFWLGDWNGDGLDEVFVNDPEKVLVLDGYGEVIDTIPDHLIYVFDLLGDSRAEAVTLTGIEPGMQMKIVTNNRPNYNPRTNKIIEHRTAGPEMYNSTRY
ncbi:MAG: hypothetical protein WC869_15495 [Phycisphaerae bacterium]|jgi:hypothetical protein